MKTILISLQHGAKLFQHLSDCQCCIVARFGLAPVATLPLASIARHITLKTFFFFFFFYNVTVSKLADCDIAPASLTLGSSSLVANRSAPIQAVFCPSADAKDSIHVCIIRIHTLFDNGFNE